MGTPPRGTGRPTQPPRGGGPDPRRRPRPVVADQPTEVFAAVEAGGSTALKEKPQPASLGKSGVAIRTAGEILITLGLVVLLFMVYEVYVTDLFSAEKQSAASDQLQGDWAKDRTLHPGLVDGKAFARIHIPAFGADFNFTIQEGTGEDSLAIGPGHYKGTALPGEPGNFGVAGHRVGKGAPFNDLDNLSSCDQIVIETQTDFYIYKVLPYDDEISGWSSGKGAQPECKGVSTLRNPSIAGGGAYDQTFGRKVVLPSQGDAVNPVPYKPADTLPKAQEASLLTLTTCHPQFSAKQRLIITSVLTQQVPKSQVADYGKLLTEIGGAA
ncbi:class E sortase [Amycolatopsis carbonis]|uniref:Class E sortase n=1 Tax=Amycolatopsis carbonis TaxID=715471 RepID=A0A9Y2IJQ9_9PSEU|nr:class E sortase [Amycolatopsis sp. 2-15]WIX80689.1 class E sortase [Amycolatopsis sp. 2-15]